MQFDFYRAGDKITGDIGEAMDAIKREAATDPATAEHGAGYMLGAKITAHLKQHGITQAVLAEKAGLAFSRIAEICAQEQQADCIEYYKICKALKVPLETFFTA